MVPKRAAIIRANRYMVEHSDYLIAYAWHLGNAQDLVEYAMRRKLQSRIKITFLPSSKQNYKIRGDLQQGLIFGQKYAIILQ